MVLITLLAGWCLLGLEALVGEVGGVFGGAENHQPLPLLSREILLESVEGHPRWAGWYVRRVAGRCGEQSDEVRELEGRCRRAGAAGGEAEWVPSFS